MKNTNDKEWLVQALAIKKDEISYNSNNGEKEMINEAIRKEFIFGIFKELAKRDMTMAEYIEYWDRFNKTKEWNKTVSVKLRMAYGIREFVLDVCGGVFPK